MNTWVIGKKQGEIIARERRFLQSPKQTWKILLMHANRVCKDFEIKNFVEYYDLYFQTDKLLQAPVFSNFQNTS